MHSNYTLLTKTTPCYRILFVRNPHSAVHEVEVQDGITAARENPPAPKMTERGKNELTEFLSNLESFVQRQLTPTTFDTPRFYCFSKRNAVSCEVLSHIGVEVEEFNWNNFTDAPDKIVPIVVFGSADEVISATRSQTDIRDFIYVCPPLLSVTMFDYRFGPEHYFCIHCVNNTELCPSSKWWHNTR